MKTNTIVDYILDGFPIRKLLCESSFDDDFKIIKYYQTICDDIAFKLTNKYAPYYTVSFIESNADTPKSIYPEDKKNIFLIFNVCRTPWKNGYVDPNLVKLPPEDGDYPLVFDMSMKLPKSLVNVKEDLYSELISNFSVSKNDIVCKDTIFDAFIEFLFDLPLDLRYKN